MITLFERRRLVNGLLVASLVLNFAILAYLTYSGGVRRVFIKLNWLDVAADRAEFQEEIEARFRKLPNRPGRVIFAGDSLIARGPWPDFFGSVYNRGIGGETTSGLLRRLDEITEDQPRRLVLLIGANDLAAAVTPTRLLANYRAILERIRDETPKTETVVLGVLPVNRSFKSAPNYTNARVDEVNRGLRALVSEFPGARFVDLTDDLTNGEGDLRPEFTEDGLHLNTNGYLAIREGLEAFAPDGDRSRDDAGGKSTVMGGDARSVPGRIGR